MILSISNFFYYWVEQGLGEKLVNTPETTEMPTANRLVNTGKSVSSYCRT